MYQTNIRDLITKLPQSNKIEHFLMNKFSNQDEVQQLQQQISMDLEGQYTKLLTENKAKLNHYVKVHQDLEPLIKDIESSGITLNIEKLPGIKENMLEKAKNEQHRTKVAQFFDSLYQALDATNHLYTQLSLFGTRTHRITSKRFNVQGLPKAIQQIIVPSQFKKVFTIDFKSFEPSVVAYMTQDEQLIEYLNHEEGLYDVLLNELSLDKGKRKYVKRAFIGSFLFGGRYSSSNFKINQEISEVNWLNLMSKFAKVTKLKEQVEKNKTMPMPYGVEHEMDNHQGHSIMALYVQTVSSYIFKHVLLEVYKMQCKQNNFRILMPIHDAIMIECDDEEIAQSVAQLMKNTANQLFDGEFAHVTVEALGGISNE